MQDITENNTDDLINFVINDESLNLELESLEDESDVANFVDDLEMYFLFTDEQRDEFTDYAVDLVRDKMLTFEDVINSFINGQFAQFVDQAEEYDDSNYDFLESLECTNLISDTQKIKALKILVKNYSSF